MPHRLLSCWYCGGPLRPPVKEATDPLRGGRVAVCGADCASGLWSLGRKLERNAAALETARRGQTVMIDNRPRK